MSLAPDYSDYTIGWICALPKEMTAAVAMLDQSHDTLPQPVSDHNNYSLGSIGNFHIVIACLPSGDIGSHPAAAVATRMLATFPSLKIGLMVGIGGGVPSKEHDIRLGDVVVGIPTKGFGGIVQHDMGKNLKNGQWLRTGSLNGPPSVLKTTISKLISLHQIHGPKIDYYLTKMIERHPNLSPEFTRQKFFEDVLYEAEPEDPEAFEKWVKVDRPARTSNKAIQVHYGLIASGNQVIKSGQKRNQISRELGGVLCFEMEAAGLMNEFPCVVIRGISDYADAHKHKEWQEYAAAVAAAYTKELIMTLPVAITKESVENEDIQKILPATTVESVQVTKSEPHWLVPFSRNDHFVGREQELAVLERLSSSETSCQRIAIYGLGGVGKTQISLEFAYRKRKINPYCSVFWIPATSQSAFEQVYSQIGHMLKIPGIGAKGADIKQLVRDRMSEKDIGPWLLIVDNADDIDMVFHQARDEGGMRALIDYLPFSLQGSILFTTRSRIAAVKQAANNTIHLEMMGADDAKKLLESSISQQQALADVNATEQLLDLLGYLPLAIIQAAAYINENDTTISEYKDLYNDNETEIMKILSEDFEDQGRYRTTKNSIATTWLISLYQIKHKNPLAIELLSFMACLANQNIPQSLLLPAPSRKQGIEAIGALTAYSFVDKQEVGQLLSMHRLVHLAMRNWLRNEKTLDTWTSKALSRLLERLPAGGHENRTIWTPYLPHANYLLSSLEVSEDDEAAIALSEKLAQCLYSNGLYSAAHQVHERTLALQIKASGPESPDTLRTMFGLAETLSHQGKYKEAEKLHRKTLELRKKVLGTQNAEVGRSMNYLAQAMFEDGKYIEAEKLHREALDLQIEIFSPEHPNALTTTGYLAETLSRQGKYKEAEEIHRNLLDVRLRVQGEEYPGTLATMSCLGVAQRNLKRYCEAEQTHRRVVELRIRVLGAEHPHTLISRRWLADSLLNQENYDEATSRIREVLELQTKLLGRNHPNTIVTLTDLGNALFRQGENDQAKELYQQTLSFRTERLGPEHPETLISMNHLAHALYNQGKYDEAKELHAKVLQLRTKVLGTGHPDTVSSNLLLKETYNIGVL